MKQDVAAEGVSSGAVMIGAASVSSVKLQHNK